MKDLLRQLVRDALAAVPALESLPDGLDIEIERTRDESHGDFACNVAMRLAREARMSPRDLAAAIVAALPENAAVERVEIAGPGFVNFFVARSASFGVVARVLEAGARFGRAAAKSEPRILVEYVSANPTGPLHVGHGRHAAFGASVSALLGAAGYPVEQEYYVNDHGRQMEILAVSVLVRLLQRRGESVAMPAAGYQGEYIGDIAAGLDPARFAIDAAELLQGLPDDEPGGDKERHIDALIAAAQRLLGDEPFHALRRHALEAILDDIRDDLAAFGVVPDRWFSEESLDRDATIDRALGKLEQRGLLYEKDGATWFRATDFGDEKDRVVVRDNGKKTYFASDIAYHFDKRERGFDCLLDVLGSDHHGYVARVRAGLEAMGEPGDSLEVRLVQFVSLYRDGAKVQMSTRSGEFVTLRQLRGDVGNDAARFFYVMRSNDQHLDFDLDLATSRSNDNPVYYVQYAHARVASVFRKLAEAGHEFDRAAGLASLGQLREAGEKRIADTLSRYPETIATSAERRAPHLLVNYLRDLATEFHALYNAHPFIVDDPPLRNARLALILAVQQVVANGLGLLGVSAPDEM